MSKAEELAKDLECRHNNLYGNGSLSSSLTKSAAHLRALDASHQRLLEALEQCSGDINPERGYADELEKDISAALEQAKALS